MSRALPVAKRRELDDYPTPPWAVDAILPFLPIPREGDILEPASGVGTILQRLETVCGIAPCRLKGIEVNEARVAEARLAGYDVRHEDALDPWTAWGMPALIVSNPPYRYAEEYCLRALQAVVRGGTVAMLLRLAFLESAKRFPFHERFPVNGLYVFSQRPSFSGNGRTDFASYAWFVWGPHQPGLRVLPPTNPASKNPGRMGSGDERDARGSA